MLIEVEVSLERFLFLLLVGFCFQRLVLLSVPQAREQFDQCDQVEEERGRSPI